MQAAEPSVLVFMCGTCRRSRRWGGRLGDWLLFVAADRLTPLVVRASSPPSLADSITDARKQHRVWQHSNSNCKFSLRSRFRISAAPEVVGTLVRHHQKCILVDTESSVCEHQITAFVGGFDLGAGRYDTPTHSPFHDLYTVFNGDIYKPTFSTDAMGPRQPSHEMHCRLDGPRRSEEL
ncbi:hypothetical protein ACP70R_018080 [Stipagrostis hirtigluma subsp. patula]